MYIFFKVIVKLDVDAGRFVRREVYEVARVESCFRLEAGLYPKEGRKRQKSSGISQKDICGERRP